MVATTSQTLEVFRKTDSHLPFVFEMSIKLFVTFHTFQELLARETILSIHTETQMKGKTFLDRYKKVFRFLIY